MTRKTLLLLATLILAAGRLPATECPSALGESDPGADPNWSANLQQDAHVDAPARYASGNLFSNSNRMIVSADKYGPGTNSHSPAVSTKGLNGNLMLTDKKGNTLYVQWETTPQPDGTTYHTLTFTCDSHGNETVAGASQIGGINWNGEDITKPGPGGSDIHSSDNFVRLGYDQSHAQFYFYNYSSNGNWNFQLN
jgi:hypothetical protein